KTILSLADRLLLKLLLNNTSRMTGDCHVRFCERLKGETPFDLLGERNLVLTRSARRRHEVTRKGKIELNLKRSGN
ncbi:MAG: hypothetical protein Q8N83_05330, partial [Ignavibacteria bacterium]|nr:hypothetical protein [Ignavibacteria bacterium]